MSVALICDDLDRARLVRHAMSPLGFPTLRVVPYAIATVELELAPPVILMFEGDSSVCSSSALYGLITSIQHLNPELIMIAIADNPSAQSLFSYLTLGAHAVFLSPFLPDGLEDIFQLIQQGIPFGEALLADSDRNKQLAVLIWDELLSLHQQLLDRTVYFGPIERAETEKQLERVLRMASSFGHYYDSETKKMIRTIFERYVMNIA
ncbi:MAG: hypothetical protein KDD62_02235 [Bdellovibrionales bacterium]|nr:hypothetical protein [Bdellovibrionales bacterium]